MKGDTLILLTRLPERQTTAALLEEAVMELARVTNHLQEPDRRSILHQPADPGLWIQNIMDPGTAGHLPDARPLASSARGWSG